MCESTLCCRTPYAASPRSSPLLEQSPPPPANPRIRSTKTTCRERTPALRQTWFPQHTGRSFHRAVPASAPACRSAAAGALDSIASNSASPAAYALGPSAGSPPFCRILAVVEHHDARARQHRRRPGLRKRAVKMPGPRPQQFHWIPVRILDRRPVNRIVRRRQPDRALAPVHPVAPGDLRGDQPPVLSVASRFPPTCTSGLRTCRPMPSKMQVHVSSSASDRASLQFPPNTSCDSTAYTSAHRCRLRAPRCADLRRRLATLSPSGHLPPDKTPARPTLEVDAVVALRQAQPRGVPANLHRARVIFRAIEHVDLSVAHNGRRIEGVQRLPLHRRLRNRILKRRGRIRRHHWIARRRSRKRPDHPRRCTLRTKPLQRQEAHPAQRRHFKISSRDLSPQSAPSYALLHLSAPHESPVNGSRSS